MLSAERSEHLDVPYVPFGASIESGFTASSTSKPSSRERQSMAEDVTAAVVSTPGPRSSQAYLSSVGTTTLCLYWLSWHVSTVATPLIPTSAALDCSRANPSQADQGTLCAWQYCYHPHGAIDEYKLLWQSWWTRISLLSVVGTVLPSQWLWQPSPMASQLSRQ